MLARPEPGGHELGVGHAWSEVSSRSPMRTTRSAIFASKAPSPSIAVSQPSPAAGQQPDDVSPHLLQVCVVDRVVAELDRCGARCRPLLQGLERVLERVSCSMPAAASSDEVRCPSMSSQSATGNWIRSSLQLPLTVLAVPRRDVVGLAERPLQGTNGGCRRTRAADRPRAARRPPPERSIRACRAKPLVSRPPARKCRRGRCCDPRHFFR